MSNSGGRNRRSKNTVTTKSGNTIKINRSLSDRRKARKASLSAHKAAWLATLPKERWKRLLYRLQPKHLADYWFSRQGGVMALKIIGVSIVAGFFITIGLFAYFRKDLPKIKNLSGDLGGNITYYDRTGQTVLFNDYNSVKRVPVKGQDISKYAKEATVAVEDKDFFKHGAFDVRGIMRAAFRDATGGSGAVQGGSTITQQLVKLNENWTNNRTVTRKVKELILAVELEREYSKGDILTGYLNIAPYGGQEYGIETAARDYFQVGAKDLTLAQSAMLAAIPQSPSYYSPYAGHAYNPAVSADSFNPTAMLSRQHYILDLMVQQHYITKQQADEAKQVDILAQVHQQSPKYAGIKAPYFVLAAKQELEQTYGSNLVARGGWKVITTLDLNLQNKAEGLVASNLNNVERRTAGLADEEATVTEDVQTGQIVALVGGTDFSNEDHGKINYAATSKIAPGSSFKPYDYTTLIDNNNNVGAGSVLYDTEGPLPGYPCTKKGVLPKNGGDCLKDYDFLQPGPLTLRYALGGSRNIPAVKAMYEAVPNDKSPSHTDSVNKVISTASAMMDNTYLQSKHQQAYNCYQGGIDINNATAADTTQCYGAAAIGDGAFLHLDDHVNGLSTLGRLGKAIPRTYIMKITDASQKAIYQWKQPTGKQVVKADAAFIVNNMASDPNASYLPGSCSATTCSRGGYKFHRYNGWNFAIKTGTTNNGFDGLMTSWSTKYAVVSWVGNHTRNVDISSRTGTAMEYLTEPLTRGMMEAAHDGLKADNWVQPKTVKTAPAFIVRNHVHYGDIEPSPANDLFPGWYAGGGTIKTTAQTIDKVSGKVATSCTPPAAKQFVSNGNAASWNVDIFNGGRQSIGSSTSGTTGGSAPTDDVHNCNDSPPTVTLTAPDPCDTSCTITATVTQGTHPFNDPAHAQYPGTLVVTLNGQTIYSAGVGDPSDSKSFAYTPTSSGSGTLTAAVTDSVLYSGNASQTLNFSNPPPPTAGAPAITQPSNNQHVGATTIVKWSSGSPNYTLFVNGSAWPGCSNTPATQCTVSITGNTTLKVMDANSKSSDTVTVSP